MDSGSWCFLLRSVRMHQSAVWFCVPCPQPVHGEAVLQAFQQTSQLGFFPFLLHEEIPLLKNRNSQCFSLTSFFRDSPDSLMFTSGMPRSAQRKSVELKEYAGKGLGLTHSMSNQLSSRCSDFCQHHGSFFLPLVS